MDSKGGLSTVSPIMLLLVLLKTPGIMLDIVIMIGCMLVMIVGMSALKKFGEYLILVVLMTIVYFVLQHFFGHKFFGENERTLFVIFTYSFGFIGLLFKFKNRSLA